MNFKYYLMRPIGIDHSLNHGPKHLTGLFEIVIGDGIPFRG